MEPKFKEQVNRNPNQDLLNTPAKQWSTEAKMKTAIVPAYAILQMAKSIASKWSKLARQIPPEDRNFSLSPKARYDIDN